MTHIWFTIAPPSPSHLKEIVIRAYWDANTKPIIEVPVGDLFGLNLGQYVVYQSAYLNCSSVKALNCYFAMPFKRSALITATNEGQRQVDSFYSNFDYKLVPALPDDKELNPTGRNNYIFMETRGRGHLMGVTMGVLQNTDN